MKKYKKMTLRRTLIILLVLSTQWIMKAKEQKSSGSSYHIEPKELRDKIQRKKFEQVKKKMTVYFLLHNSVTEQDVA